MNQLTIHADQGTTRISRHIYGHFAEHLGTCIEEGLWVGEDSPIPNTRGIRNDVLDALGKLDIPNIRWPGGCFAENYCWRDGIGPREDRPLTINSCWGGIAETNHFGTHEFMDLCGLLGAEPYICGNVATGTSREMEEWIEYLTMPGDSSLSRLRRRNGREEPWPLKYWGVGNENWGCGGNMTARQYAWEFRKYQTFCRHAGGGKLYKVACGYGDEWNDELLREAHAYMDGLSIHHYSRLGDWSGENAPDDFTLHGHAVDFGEKQWWDILRLALDMDDFIARTSALMDRKDPEKRIGLIVDEWGTWHLEAEGKPAGSLYQQNTIRDALVAAVTLNIFHRHADRVHMANIAQMVNVLQAMVLTDGPRMLRTPTYHVFEMYKAHQDATFLRTELACERRTIGGWQLPMLSASASRDAGGRIHLSICNLDPAEAASLSCEIPGVADWEPAAISGRVLAASEMNAHNTFDAPDAVAPAPFTAFRCEAGRLVIELPARSVAVLEIVD